MRLFTKAATPGDRGRAPGRLKLKLSGFSQQELATPEEIVLAIDLLPRFHLEGLREISFDPTPPQDVASYRSGRIVTGTRRAGFIQRERRIVIYPCDNAPLFWQVLFHEIGHYVFFAIIDSHTRKHWVTGLHPNYFCVSEYATRDAQEDFAESYAAYVLAPHLLAGIEAKFAFMLDSVFCGTAIHPYTGSRSR